MLCASCHGPRGAGDGPAGQNLEPRPARHDDGAYMNALSNQHLFRVIKEGGAALGKSPLMAPWGGALSDAQIWDVVVRPSRDLGVLAGELISAPRNGARVPTWVRLLQRALGLAGEPFEADLLSYVLFDRIYTGPLVRLGMEDARRQEEELLRFFSDD